MDPFRDDLAAAHAKITRLEEHVHRLEHGRGKREKKRLPRSMIVYFLFSILIFVVLGAVTIGTVLAFMRSDVAHRRAQVPTTSASTK
ncbi:MAG: hypothetical protein ABI461_19335 [Polyangiaceae bacterium]